MPPRDREPGLSCWWWLGMAALTLCVFRAIYAVSQTFIESLRVFR